MGSDHSCIFIVKDGKTSSTLYYSHKDNSYVWENKHSKVSVDVEIGKGMNVEKVGYRNITPHPYSSKYYWMPCNYIEYRGKSDDGKYHKFHYEYACEKGEIMTIMRRDEDITKYVIRSRTGVNQFVRTIYLI